MHQKCNKLQHGLLIPSYRMDAASANGETRSLSVQTMSAFRRKVRNVVTGVTSDLKSVEAPPHKDLFTMCYHHQHLAITMC
jgi:hypothetical protein